MASPKHLTRTLFEQWETVEAPVRATREMPAFSEEQVLAAIRQAQPALDDVQVREALRRLLASGVLEVQSRSESFVVNTHVLEFVRGLTHEHELGLSSVIQARIEAIRGATETLTAGIEAGDTVSRPRPLTDYLPCSEILPVSSSRTAMRLPSWPSRQNQQTLGLP